MPPRLNKRQQREQEELATLGRPTDAIDESSEEEVAPKPVGPGAGFAALFTPDEDVEVSEDDTPSRASKSKKPKKKKKKAAPAASQVDTPPEAQPKVEKKAGKKAKGKGKKDDKDDLDAALAELSVKYPELQNISASTAAPSAGSSSSTIQSLSTLLSVSLPHLDSEAEMKRFFGAKVISASKAGSSSPAGSSKRQAGAQRSHLTRPQPSWWAVKQREGLSIRPLVDNEIEHLDHSHHWDAPAPIQEKWWTVEYSKKYRGVTMSFMQTVMSGDPEGFYRLLGKLPWHADTLLQLSEVYRHREEYSTAVDYVERALFTYERSFVGAFAFTTGTNRLDFDRVENRPFFLALHRQVTDLQRRGCVRTAFEFARLLYALDPWTDPHGALLHLDYLALKTGMGQWLLDVWDYFNAASGRYRPRLDPSVLPGWAYARALAMRAQEDSRKDTDHEASTEALKEAVTSFPAVVPLLADKADIALSADIRGHESFRIHTDNSGLSDASACLHLMSHLYAQRSAPLWKPAKISKWFSATVESLFPTPPGAHAADKRRTGFEAVYTHDAPRYSVYRHIMVLESSYRRLFSFIPRAVVNSKQLACDPLPPPTRVSEYDQEFFRGTEDVFSVRARTRRDRVADERMLERLVPDPVFRGQLQAFFDAHPRFAERFPGGIVQFAQVAGQLPEEVLEDLMIAEAMDGGAELEDRGMPGQMPGEADMMLEFPDEGEGVGMDVADAPQGGGDAEHDYSGSEGEESLDDDEDEEDVAPMPVRVLRNIMNRFWGTSGGPGAEDSSDDDTDRIPVDNAGVD